MEKYKNQPELPMPRPLTKVKNSLTETFLSFVFLPFLVAAYRKLK